MKSMPRDDLILFLDLETTGSDVDLDEIIEVGLVMIDATTYDEKDVFQSIIVPSDAAYMRMVRNNVVRKMHEENGLLLEINAALSSAPKTDEEWQTMRPTYPVVDRNIVEWLWNFTKADRTHLVYGGSGVSHFDRPFIKKYLRGLDVRITHFALDVGSTRRQAEKAGIPPLPQTTKTHRALDDARFHVEEFRYYQRIWKGE